MLRDLLDFSNRGVSAEERLANAYALTRGLGRAMAALFERMERYSEFLAEELGDSPAAVDYLNHTRRSTQRGLAWLTTLGENSRFELEREPLDVCLLVDGAARRCRRILGDQRVGEVPFRDEEIVVPGSLFLLQDLFLNAIFGVVNEGLCGNRPLGIQAAIWHFDERFLKAVRSACPPDDYLVVSFAPEGVEFDAQHQLPVWDALLEHMEASPGFCLTMIQMYGTLLTHGGDMLIRPLGENRFSFTMLLPLSTKIKEMQAPHNLDDEALRGTETILLVDDEDMIWDVIIDMLQELGYTVILAADGRDAVEIYESNPGEIDLVILDMLMPGMDGHDTFFALKELDPNVKVLLSSGYVSEEDARDVLNAGAAGFLQKPYRMADLAQRVRTIVESGA